MTRLGGFLEKQGRFLLENEHLAWVYIAILAVVPFATWLSTAIIALITLRKGWTDGFKGLIVAFAAFMALSLMSMSFSVAFFAAVLTFLPCFLFAVVLRSTASWKTAGAFIVLLALLVIVLIHWLIPEFITNQYQIIQAMFKQLGKDGSDSSVVTQMLSLKDSQSQLIIANYFLGVQSVSIVLSAITSMLLARAVQSMIFYPGGFRREMLTFRASGLEIILLVIVVIGAYQRNPLAISCLPMLVVYYVFAGLSLVFNVVAKNKGIGTLILFLIPMLVLPFFMLPIYVIIGALDSLFNLRLHLSSRADGKSE